MGLGDFFDFGLAAVAGLVFAAVDVELALEIAELAVAVGEVFERRTASFDGIS